MEILNVSLSERLLNLRAKNDWTQKELAEKLGVTPVTISQLETEMRSRTSKLLAFKIDLLEKGE